MSLCQKISQNFPRRWKLTIMVIIILCVPNILLSLKRKSYGDKLDENLEVSLFVVTPNVSKEQLSRLPDLNAINWPTPIVSSFPAGVPKGDGQPPYLPPPFDPAISLGQLKLYRRLMQTFSHVMFKNGLGDSFMLTAGTLAGSFYHHDFIPWDDEVDILINVKVRDRVRFLLSALKPDYQIAFTKNRDKFFAKTSNFSPNDTNFEGSLKIHGRTWNWPFLDLPYFTENETHITEMGPAYVQEMSWPKDIVYPLYFRPFGPAWFPAPKNPLRFLAMRYGKNTVCRMSGSSHVLEKPQHSASGNCKELVRRYPYVDHKPCGDVGFAHGNNGVVMGKESLSVHSEYWNPSPIHSICLATAKESARAPVFIQD